MKSPILSRETLRVHIAARIVGELPSLAGEVRWLALDPGLSSL